MHLGGGSQNLYGQFYRVNFPKNTSGKVVIDMSFTYLHWKVAEALGNEDAKLKVSSMEE